MTEAKNKPAAAGADNNNQAGDAGATAAAAAAAAEAGNAANDSGAAAGDEIFRPDGLPDHLIGKSNRETLEKLSTAYINSRKEIGENKGMPKSPDAYSYDGIPDEIKSQVFRMDESGKDPFFEAMRPHLLAAGVTLDGAPKLIAGLAQELGKFQAQLQQESEEGIDFDFKALGGKEKAQPQIDAGNAFITGLVNQDKISEAVANELRLNLTHGGGLEATLALLRLANGGQDIPVHIGGKGGGDDDGVKQEKLNAMMKDERYWKPGKRDPAFVAEVDRGFAELYGNASA